MIRSPLVSIIVPVYNVEKFIDDCLRSIQEQSYKKIEVLMIDDGSIDNSAESCKRYKEKDSRFKLFTKSNGGLSDARNYGIEKSTGEYICFVDSDDIIDSKMIETLLNAIQETNTKIAGCEYLRFNKELKPQKKKSLIKRVVITNRDFLINTYYQKEQNLFSVSACAKLYHKSIFSKVRYKKNIIYEDFNIIDKVIQQTNKIALIKTPLYYYRKNESGITNRAYSTKSEDALKHCEELIKEYAKDYEIRTALEVNKYTRCIELLTIKKRSGIKTSAKDPLYLYLKKNRRKILTNKKVRKSVRCAAILAYISPKIVIQLNAIRK